MLLSNHLMETKNLSSVGNTAASGFMKEHFMGEFQRETIVPKKYKNSNTESFICLSYHLSPSIERSIREQHSQIDVEVNLGTSSSTNQLSGKTQLCITKFPSVLHVHLKRFDNSNRKICSSCSFGDILDLNGVLVCDSDPPQYLLHSVLVHIGSRASGHHYVFIRPDITKNDWFCFDDSKVTRVSQKQAIDANFHSDRDGPTAYMLIYVKKSSQALLQVQSLKLPYDEKEELVKEAVVIVNRIIVLNENSFLITQGRRRQAAVDFQIGHTCLDKLTVVVDEMYQRYSDSIALLSKRVAEAFHHLQTVVGKLVQSESKEQFLRRCESFASRFDEPQFVDASNFNPKPKPVTTLPVLPSIHPQPASAARFAHAFPYKFPQHLKFDLSFLPTVSTSIASSLFAEFKRVSANFEYVQYADDHFVKSAKYNERHLCLGNRPATTVKNLLFVGSDTLDWFFVSLATLYPDVLVLSNFLIHWNLQFKTECLNMEWFSLFLRNVKDRRPKFVFHPLNLPQHLDRVCDKDTNPEYHYVLTFIVFDWSESEVSSKITVLDPFSDDSYIDAAVQLYKKGGYFSSFNPVFQKRQINPIQLGDGNIHCGVYILALALNAIFGTLDTMNSCLNPGNSENTCEQGLLLRKFVCWDSTQFPSLLDTFLLACPKFSPISSRSVAVKASAWWLLTPYHNIADSLAIKYGSIFIPVYFSRGKFWEQDRMIGNCSTSKFNADGPLFFSNKQVLVKVICIGLIGHRLAGDRKAAKRAAFAFQECCSTPFVCSKKDWFCETFGLICVGLVCPCAFVCIVRTLGTLVQNDVSSLVGRSFHDLSSLQFQSSPPKPSAPFRVFHGDPHGRNEVLVDSQVQLIDCDKTFLITGECPPLFLFTWYAASIAEQPRNPYHIRALMRIIGRSGLNASHAYFARFYTADTFLTVTFDADLFEESPKPHWEYDAFLHLFQLISDAGFNPKLISDNEIHCKLDNNITIHGFDKPKPGNIEVSCADGIVKKMLLSSSSETVDFFQRICHKAQQKGCDTKRQKMLDTEAAKDRESAQATAASGQTEPTICCVRLDHLMRLLTQEASDKGDPTPQLQHSHEKEFISCQIRPRCSRDAVVPCQIFFERIATGLIKICSAEFQPHEKESFLQENFRKHSMLFNLESEEEVERFFSFALSMKNQYGNLSDDSSDCDSDGKPSRSSLGKKGLGQEVYNVRECKEINSSVRLSNQNPIEKSDRPNMGWPNWLYWKLVDCGNDLVLNSIRRSMMNRFGNCGSLKELKISPKSEPLNALRPEHFGCKVVLVNNATACDRCLNFIADNSHLSFDTESPVPQNTKNPKEGICLIQIGTTTNVFIIQVANQSSSFWTSLEHNLNATKKLICWGDDEKALKSVLPRISCKFRDLQKKFSPLEQKKGIDKCVEVLFQNKYVLSKTWTLSGWDNPQLTEEQIRYASLDVVACHALFLSRKSMPVYESSGVYITFYATDFPTKLRNVRHGFCFSPNFLGHYKNDVVSRGFDFGSNEELHPRLTGFCAFDDTSHGVVQVDVNAFLQLMNDYKFCCSLCSGCWFWNKECRFFLKQFRDSFSYIKGRKSTSLYSSVNQASTNTDEQDAFFCLSMVAIFFRMSPSKDRLQSLKKSVCSDIYYGYIRETLSHLI
jgi:hypothetical protein